MMKINHYEPIHETLYREQLASGLELVILPKRGFIRKAATLVVPFGSVDEEILLEGTEKPYLFPQGTAHFLEHMLFESGAESISRKFALVGASVNAYTTYNRTAVYFSTTNGIEEPLKLLFDMMNETVFESEAIQKERLIIAKEIMMYKDDVEQEMYYDMMNSLYSQNTIRYDVAGTIDSIKKIDEEVLKIGFQTFYHPKNMVLVLTGDIAIESVSNLVKNHAFFQRERQYLLKGRIHHLESRTIQTRTKKRQRDLKTDLVMLGIKCGLETLITPEESALKEIKQLLLLDNYIGRATKNQRILQNKNLINNAFDFSISCDETFAHAIIFTESKRPEKTLEEWQKLISELPTFRPDIEGFRAQKQKIIGGFIQVFDSVSRLNALLSDFFVRGINIFDLIEKISLLELEDLETCALELASAEIASVHYTHKIN